MNDLPLLTGSPAPLTGVVRAEPADFRVDEVPAYAPEGSGDHLFVRFEKEGLDTPEAVRRIAAVLGVSANDAGWAGLKDRHAITRQWASFLFADPARLDGQTIEGVRVLETARHRHKLRTGHLRANRFELRIRCEDIGGLDAARTRLDELARRGAPAYFGEQRFGREGQNLEAARRWIIEGGRPPKDRWKRKLYVSTLQSALFNELLSDRIREGTMDGALPGDLFRKEDSGGLFVSEDTGEDRARAARFEISATGPMFGDRMRWPEGEAKAREEAALERWGLSREHLARFRSSGEGTRRPYRFRIEDASIDAVPEGALVRFTLPSGAYATVVLRELVRPPG